MSSAEQPSLLLTISPYKRDIPYICLLLIIVGCFFWPQWGQGAWLPHGGGDAVSFLYPMYRFIAATLHEGSIPLWNPHQYAGYPLIADNQAGIFYPLHLLLFLTWPDFPYEAIEWLVAGHFFWAGLGMYICIRGWNQCDIPRPAAVFAAVAFMLSDVFITHIGNVNLIAVASWLPWAMWTFHQAISVENRRRWTISCGMIMGISTVAGHGQMTFIIALMLGVYALWETIFDHNRQALPCLFLVGLLNVGLSALILLPSLDMNRFTQRGTFSYESSINYSIPFEALIGLINPTKFGRGAAHFTGSWDRVEVGYMGILPLLLICVALIRNKQKKTDIRFLTIAAIFFMLLALGGNTPIHRWTIGMLNLPFQVPARFVLLTNFCIAMLSAFALATIKQKKIVWCAIVIITADLLFHGMYVEVEWNNPIKGFERTEAITYLQKNAGLNRIDEATAQWQPSTAQTVNLYSAGGVYNPLQLATHAGYMGSVGYRGSPLYNLMGIKYIVSDKTEPPGDTKLVAPVFNGDPAVDIWLNTNALPRAIMYYQSMVVPDHDAAFAAIHSDVNLAQTIVVEEKDGVQLDQLSGVSQINISLYKTNRVVIDVTTDRPGYLFLSDIYYPHWQATINGEPTTIIRANYAFRAVLLDAGTHQVDMMFRPPSWRNGVAITMVTLLITTVAFFKKVTINNSQQVTNQGQRLLGE